MTAEPKIVPWAQGVFPVFAILALSAHMARGLYLGTSSGPAAMTAHAGLRSIPLILFFVLRDTHYAAIWATWFISCATQLLFCIHDQSVDSYVSLLMYALVLGSTSYETMRHSAAVNDLVRRLQETLAENERLAVEAQALELRAMIGNVAHDLKTVSLACCIACR
jgi:signal transduction histidine kinase